MNADFQFGTWIPSLQVGNGIIRGQYTDQIGNWARIGQQVFISGFFRLDYHEAQVEAAVRRNTTVQEIRLGTLPFEAGSGASIFNLMVSNNHFIRTVRAHETEVLSVGARSIWGSPRMRVFANERALTGSTGDAKHTPIARDLSLPDLSPSTYGVFTEIRVSGTYLAFPDLSRTDPVNTPLPTVTQPAPPPPAQATYAVRPGDTLWLLSQQFGTTADRLMALNGLTNTALHIGQVLLIPEMT
ncbi:MAG: LysM peptidoglycan-binding domain-containing protein [Oscillospiraceae bacterium]|nr:LysM peptidoglycan-binding domain-containing protein [Oscillospiraceae bacterium]